MSAGDRDDQDEADATTSAAIQIAVMRNDVRRIKEDVKSILTKLDTKYVTTAEFDPVKRLVYGLVGLVLVAVAGALFQFIFKRPTP